MFIFLVYIVEFFTMQGANNIHWSKNHVNSGSPNLQVPSWPVKGLHKNYLLNSTGYIIPLLDVLHGRFCGL